MLSAQAKIKYTCEPCPSRRLLPRSPTRERISGAIVVDMRNQVAQELCAFEPRDGCGYCRRALGAEVRIECAECTPRLLLCVDCLRAGVSIHTRGHTPAHKYRVIDVGSDALLEVGWRGTDELRLLEGVQLYGFGNWMDIAEHVGGGRSREAVERHYRRCYLEPPEEEFRYQGWMPLRQEFDVEWEDEAEALVSEIEFVPGELEAVEAGVAREKMQKLHTYNATLDGRQWRHELVVARDLLDDVHEQIEIERIAPVAEVAARARLRPLARFHSAAQHEELVQSVLKQQGMALDLRHLQAAAAKGITSLREARPLAELCERLALPRHLLPRAKRQLVLAALAGGGLARREAAAVLRPEVDTARAAMLWDYCVGAGWVQPPAAEAGESGAA
ncbi:hypothetical protein EMIHUDRAFT_202596 [Emiliania huxleyi CCMP1516]|uniref:Transcriptional adapter n=2 Tax=Emiliania huxleyi TaxID=2903 RepID=A0A0D3K8G0_EMIH1|nr:hypothetical protein EMIHUDRAFT_202596 [Emiliania huxleyi CCMP1516]EOD32045.1 hypothetical protein EMIHUDRAFT_202596 [Emiliania huxleyi CCMP1516]|eukprot:XP_005784474.1 hypothetical protein EMIHUDRAFT_202596 [Emiliania huxleyi CCMP1516]